MKKRITIVTKHLFIGICYPDVSNGGYAIRM